MLSSTSFYRLFSRTVALFLWKVFFFFVLYISRDLQKAISWFFEGCRAHSLFQPVVSCNSISGDWWSRQPVIYRVNHEIPRYGFILFFSLTVIKRIAGTTSKDLVGVLIFSLPFWFIVSLYLPWSFQRTNHRITFFSFGQTHYLATKVDSCNTS